MKYQRQNKLKIVIQGTLTGNYCSINPISDNCRSTWEGPHHLNFFDDHASGIGYLRFRQQKARLASFLNVPTANLGLIP